MPALSCKVSLFVTFLILFFSTAIPAQDVKPALENGRPLLRFADSKGCTSFVSYGFLDGRDESLGVPVVHWHGGKMGEMGLLYITKTALIYQPLEPHEHAFVMPRSTFVQAKISVDGRISYLTLKSKVKKNQEFSIGCEGAVRDLNFDFPHVLNYVVRIATNFDLGLAEFKKQISQLNSTPGTAEGSARNNTLGGEVTRKEPWQIGACQRF